ncbi:MAG: hypothetical protein H6522_08545 [Mycolicibacterium sp.]|nr:hypothetical protein [Mycolicibacterium sp.]
MFDQAAEDMAGTGFTNMCPVASVAAEVAETVDELRGVPAGVFTGWLVGGTSYLIGLGHSCWPGRCAAPNPWP